MTSVTQTETVRHTSWFSCFSSSDSGGKAPERTLQREDSALSREGFRAVEAATTKQFRSEGHPCRHRFTPLDTVRDVHNSRRDGNRGTLGARTSSGTVHSLSSVLDIQREVRPGPRVSHRRSESAVPASTPAQLMPQDWRGLRQFEFVGDIGCTSTMVTKLMQNRWVPCTIPWAIVCHIAWVSNLGPIDLSCHSSLSYVHCRTMTADQPRKPHRRPMSPLHSARPTAGGASYGSRGGSGILPLGISWSRCPVRCVSTSSGVTARRDESHPSASHCHRSARGHACPDQCLFAR